MKRFPFFLLLFLLPLLAAAQERRVYLVAGGGTSGIGDGGQATAAALNLTEGIWIDGACNLYISHFDRIRKVNLATGIITTVAGTGTLGFSGDGGPATNADIRSYGVYADGAGNVYFPCNGERIRFVDKTTGIISTVAGGGVLGDGVLATNSKLEEAGTVYLDSEGNMYIGEKAKIRKVIKATGIITTIAGTGVAGFSGDGGQATNAQVYNAQGMLMDATGNLLFADRGNNRIRKINTTTGIISTVAGSSGGTYAGDGGPATIAQIGGPISFAIDVDGNIIIGDNTNNYIRFVSASTGVISTVAGVGWATGSFDNGALALNASIHPEFLYLDQSGNLFYSNFGRKEVRRITGFKPGLASSGSNCALLSVDQTIEKTEEITILPNPAKDIVTLVAPSPFTGTCGIYNQFGQLVMQKSIEAEKTEISISTLPNGVYYLILKGMQRTKTLSFTKN